MDLCTSMVFMHIRVTSVRFMKCTLDCPPAQLRSTTRTSGTWAGMTCSWQDAEAVRISCSTWQNKDSPSAFNSFHILQMRFIKRMKYPGICI